MILKVAMPAYSMIRTKCLKTQIRSLGRSAMVVLTMLVLCCCERQLPDAEEFRLPAFESVEAYGVTSVGAVLRAAVDNGEAVGEQGFRFWKEDGDNSGATESDGNKESAETKQAVAAEMDGNIFMATLEQLDPGSRYCFEAWIGNGAGLYETSVQGEFTTLKRRSNKEITDDNFLAWLLWNYDTDKDGVLSTEEMLKVNEIEFNTGEIASLSGLGLFPNLVHLHAQGPSQNDRGLLTELDLSGNPKLQHAHLIYNQLTELILGDHPELGYLDVDYNNLSRLDVSRYPKLYLLQVCHNRLSSIDVRGLDELGEFQCDDNPATEILLANATLHSFRCASTLVSTLDLSACPKLNTVVCSSCPNLTKIYLAKGQVIGSLTKDSKAEIEYHE